MCGVMGVIKRKGNHVALDVFHGLNQLQHRGQDAAGISTFDRQSDQLHLVKNAGLVSSVFHSDDIKILKGALGIGHVRYTTSGEGVASEAQPHMMETDGLSLSLVYNGNIINYVGLRQDLEQEYRFDSECDVEVLLKLLARHLKGGAYTFDRLAEAVEVIYQTVSGAYSVVGILKGVGMFAFRDPRGVRPLLWAQEKEGCAFCSETYPLSFLDYDHIQDLPPGELIFVDEELQVQRRLLKQAKHRHCAFEYVYFAKANSQLEGHEVYRVRQELGRALARKVQQLQIPIDTVVGVPATSQPAAMAAAWSLGVRLEEGLLRKDHTGRSFILPTQGMREKAVSQKLAPVQSVFEGQRVLIVDDSIVRGTTSRAIVRIARQCGAKTVTFGSTFPRIQHPCYLGIDMAEADEFVARWRSYEQIAQHLGADSVVFNDVEDLKVAIGTDALCVACCDGKYPTDITEVARLRHFRDLCRQKQKAKFLAKA